MKTYNLARLEKDLEIIELTIRLAIKAETINKKDDFLFHMAKVLNIDVEDCK